MLIIHVVLDTVKQLARVAFRREIFLGEAELKKIIRDAAATSVQDFSGIHFAQLEAGTLKAVTYVLVSKHVTLFYSCALCLRIGYR